MKCDSLENATKPRILTLACEPKTFFLPVVVRPVRPARVLVSCCLFTNYRIAMAKRTMIITKSNVI